MKEKVITLLRGGGRSLLISALVFCQPVFGGSGNDETDSGMKAAASPVGEIKSLGAVRIDGRAARNGEVLWGNELLEAPAVESAQVTLNDAGRITLSGGSALKLAAVVRGSDGDSTLFAYLIAGSMTVKLSDRASAKICASDSIFAVSPGSSARLIVSEGHGRVLSSNGEVKEDAAWRLFRTAYIAQQAGAQATPGEYKIEPYNFTFGLGGYADIEARSVRYLQFRVTDKDDNPAPDMLLLIRLKPEGGSSSAGSINYGATVMRVMTDQFGVATVRFDAGVTIGSVSAMEVTIAKTGQALIGNIRVVKPHGFWMLQLQNALPIVTTTAGAVVTNVVAARTQNQSRSITSPGPREDGIVGPEPPDEAMGICQPCNQETPVSPIYHPPSRRGSEYGYPPRFPKRLRRYISSEPRRHFK